MDIERENERQAQIANEFVIICENTRDGNGEWWHSSSQSFKTYICSSIFYRALIENADFIMTNKIDRDICYVIYKYMYDSKLVETEMAYALGNGNWTKRTTSQTIDHPIW